MSYTKNYSLPINDSDSERFKDWRESINGAGEDSAMYKIDAALGEKADHSVSLTATLTVAGWSDGAQTIQVEGLLADTNGAISVAQNATDTQRAKARDAVLAVTGQKDGELTVVADGTVPDCDIPVVIILYD